MGGWITGPSFSGPEEFARAGYDYVGFDTQHGYLDEADVAVILRRLEYVPIAPRTPASADPAPIGRVLDAGADAVIVAMVDGPEQAAAAVAATRYAPQRRAQLRPAAGRLGHDPAALQSRVSVFAMIETSAGLAAATEICSVPGLSGVYIGPADLAISLGVEVAGATGHPRVREAMTRVQRAATASVSSRASHAGDGVTGKELAALGFQMITLAPESQALRRGAGAHLDDATGPR